MRFRIPAAIAALLLAYPVSGLVGGFVPTNSRWTEPEVGIPLFIESNGIHVGIVMPKIAAGVDLGASFPVGDLRDPRFGAYDHVSLGWGERDFYVGTPTWSDLRLSTVVRAALGSSNTLIHVDHLPVPKADGAVRRVIVRPQEYRRLVAYVRATLKPGGERHAGYFRNDAFYGAYGRYSAVHTCNAWVGDALRYAGIEVGAWTPFPYTVMRWFPLHR